MKAWWLVVAAVVAATWTWSAAMAGSCGGCGKGKKGGDAQAPTNAPAAQAQSQGAAAQ
ncbi:MAG: hypothetical protein N2652_06110 [Kiritimatiellae bacterium]|nr:hypothetical protein [Kiritimatiellia bacterium]